MLIFLLRRLLVGVPTLLGISLLCFVLLAVIIIGMVFALLWVGIAALADLVTAALDPRIRLEGR